jgi:hypothetical protein
MIPVGILTAAATSTFSFLLDEFPGAAVAYSLRKLRTAYTGNCVRIRRSSDNAELDFGFVNNYVDTAAISTFCGAGNGFVVTWYDQSGNNINNSVNTAAFPQIYFSGSFVFRSGKIYIQFSNTAQLLLSSGITRTPSQNYSFWITYEKNALGNQSILLGDSGTYLWLEYGPTAQFINGTQTINISPNIYNINTRYLVNHICDTSLVTIYSNAAAWGNRITLSNAFFTTLNSTANRSATITMAEFVLYPNSQAANRTAINTNINSFYTIY